MGMRKFCHAKPGCRFIMLVTVPETRLFRQSSFRRIGNPYRMSPWSRQIFSITKKKRRKEKREELGTLCRVCGRYVQPFYLSSLLFPSIEVLSVGRILLIRRQERGSHERSAFGEEIIMCFPPSVNFGCGLRPRGIANPRLCRLQPFSYLLFFSGVVIICFNHFLRFGTDAQSWQAAMPDTQHV